MFVQPLVLVALFATGVAVAQSTAAPGTKPAPCSAPQHRQFDFWLGDWTVRDPAGRDVGQNHLEAAHGGCVMLERWEGRGNFTGSSLTAYDAALRRWHQTWMDSQGAVMELDGGLVDGSMVLEGDSPDLTAGTTAHNRLTWTALPDGRVRQWWQQSSDGGKSWATVFDGYYTRK